MEELNRQALERIAIGPDELQRYHGIASLADQARALMLQQMATWELARQGYEARGRASVRSFEFDGFHVTVQFNPIRFASSAAPVDEKSIRERPCILCARNLPGGQRGILYDDEYLLLCNPFPIFPEHFTATHRSHIPQAIAGAFEFLLHLSRDLGDEYVLLYNGPASGASAPDHLHLQAGTSSFLPSIGELDLFHSVLGVPLLERDELCVYASRGYIRNCVLFESRDQRALDAAFRAWYGVCQQTLGGDGEPMMNLLVVYRSGWKVLLFPRVRHRPTFYFLEGEERILLSPGAVDLGGVCITPLEKDFLRITRDQIIQIYREISPGEEQFSQLLRRLKSQLQM